MDMFTDDFFEIDILDEAFYGKSSRLAKCETLFDELIAVVKKNVAQEKEYDINKDPRIKQIERLVEKEFNVGSFKLTFYNNVPLLRPGYNAFTFPTCIPLFKKDSTQKYGVNMRNAALNCHFDASMMALSTLTGGEMMALMLHEIGHNFDASVFHLLAQIDIEAFKELSERFETTSKRITAVISVVLTRAIGSKFIARVHSMFDEITTQIYNMMPPAVKNSVIKTMSNFENLVGLMDQGQFVKNIFSLKISSILIKLFNPKNIFGYGDEKFADSFATAHGYGTELSSVLRKLDNSSGLIIDDVASKSSLVAIPYDLYKVIINIALTPFDVQPKTPVRIKSQLNKLKRDLEDPNLDPGVKKELIKNIRELEDFINTDYTNMLKDENKIRSVQVLYNKVMMSKMSYTDYREWLQLVNRREL